MLVGHTLPDLLCSSPWRLPVLTDNSTVCVDGTLGQRPGRDHGLR